ncbi:MAG: DUF2157 domain-containing protein [Sphingobacteriales bacterium]|nr:MAG: DUF2157 domain-containing protein [Sphingobacteriales bacterium]
MNLPLFEKLQQEGHISPESLERLKQHPDNRFFSLHGELKLLLYLGILLFSSGIGVLVYQNLDSIGHQVILAAMAAICIGCFIYTGRNKAAFTLRKTASPNALYDYIVLLGCLMFLSFSGYLQYSYQVFGTHYGLSVFFPMLGMFFCAYYFDHLGVLSIAIALLATWAGISITPMHILDQNDFTNPYLIFTGIALGLALLAASYASEAKNFKKHFAFTYRNFGVHILLISGLAAMYHFEFILPLIFLLVMVPVIILYRFALKQKSFYFLLVSVLYGYIAVTSIFFWLLIKMPDMDLGIIYLGLFYFIITGILLVRFLMNSNKKMKS